MEIIKTQDEINVLNVSQEEIGRDIENVIKKIVKANEDIRTTGEIKKRINMIARVRDISYMIEQDEAKFNEFNIEKLTGTLENLKKNNELIMRDVSV